MGGWGGVKQKVVDTQKRVEHASTGSPPHDETVQETPQEPVIQQPVAAKIPTKPVVLEPPPKPPEDKQIGVKPAPSVPVNWKAGTLIGQGAYGKVYECLNLDTGELLVAKRVKVNGTPEVIQREVLSLKTEIELLKSLSHKNIVHYIHTEVNADFTAVDIIMEYIPGGSIRTLLDQFGRFAEPIVKRYTKQLLEGLSYLHSNGIIHRDIKSANLLVDNDGTVKLTDFGAAKRFDAATVNPTFHLSKSLKGSPYWMAPEVAKRTGHTTSADIWSVGWVVIEMLNGCPPWSNVSNTVQGVLEILKNTNQPPDFPHGASASCVGFLKAWLRVDASTRYTAEELLAHPFITDQTITAEEERAIAAEIDANPPPRPIFSYREGDLFDSREQTGKSFHFDLTKPDGLESSGKTWEFESDFEATGYKQLYDIDEIPMTKPIAEFKEIKVASDFDSISSDSEEDVDCFRNIDPNMKIAESKKARRQRILEQKQRKQQRREKRRRNEEFQKELAIESNLLDL